MAVTRGDITVHGPNDERTPVWVHCGKCRHTWIGVWLPISITKFSVILRRARCPMCAGRKIFTGRGDAADQGQR